MSRVSIPKPLPQPTEITEPFWNALAEERLALQRCGSCGRWVHYPRARCPHCGSDELGWEEVSGEGVLYTFTVARQATAPPFADEVPQLIAVVELPEGVRLSTTLVDTDPASLVVGAAVTPVFDHRPEGATLLRYRISGDALPS